MSTPRRTPEEVLALVQDTVAKGVAALGGAMAGLREGIEKGNVAQEARNLGEAFAQAVREAAEGARDEFRKPPREG